MKNAFLLFFVSLMLFSCSEETTIQESEALREVALKSPEFKEAQQIYKVYNNYKLSEIQRIADAKKSGKMTSVQYETAKEAYIQQLADKAMKVYDATQKFNKKYPKVAQEMGNGVLLEELRGKPLKIE